MVPKPLWGIITRGLPQEAKNRFKINFKTKKYINGKVDPSSVKIYTSFVEAHRTRGE